jgi:hypothetical protein
MHVTNNNIYRVLLTLNGVEPAECRKSMVDYDNFMNGIHQKLFIQTFIVHYRNAEKCYLKGNTESEIKSLNHVIHIMESDIITDQILKEENMLDYETGTLLTKEKILTRLHELEHVAMELN